MAILVQIFMFALGSVIASFIGVVTERMNTGQNIVHGRSHCDACGAELPPFALVPVLSFLMLNGRSHCCGARISWLAPISEISLGFLYLMSYRTLGVSFPLVFFCVALAALLVLSMYDFRHQILPPIPLAAFICASLVFGFFSAETFHAFGQTVLAAFGVASFVAALHFLSRGRAMGFADSPFAGGLVLLTGYASALPGLVFSFWIGGFIGIMLLALRPHSIKMNTEVPFAPFLVAGFLLAYFTQWNPFALIAVLL